MQYKKTKKLQLEGNNLKLDGKKKQTDTEHSSYRFGFFKIKNKVTISRQNNPSGTKNYIIEGGSKHVTDLPKVSVQNHTKVLRHWKLDLSTSPGWLGLSAHTY